MYKRLETNIDAVAVECAGLQLGESVATAGVAKEDRQLVTDELAAAVGEDLRPVGRACALLQAAVRRGAPESEAVRQHLRMIAALPLADG